jgi:hypothetical protein
MSDLEDVLRRALDTEASRVEVTPDALDAIRGRIAARRAWWRPGRRMSRRLSARPPVPPGRAPHRPRGAVMLGLSTAAASVVAAVLVVGGSCGPPPTTPVPVGSPVKSPPATAGQTSAPTASTAPPAGSANLPVYYLGASPGGPKLYREFHELPDGDGSTAAQLKAAITEMLDGRTAYDPDYSSQWPASASVRGVTVSGSVATVDLAGATVNGDDPAGNRAALQQLIWTATGFPGATGVKLLFDGKPRATLWKVALPVAGVLSCGPAVDVLAHVWLIDPQQGATSGRSVTVKISGIVFEGSVNLRVLTPAGVVVQVRHVQLSVGAPAIGVATLTLQVKPGTYTIEVRELSLKDGSVVSADNHVFTVK